MSFSSGFTGLQASNQNVIAIANLFTKASFTFSESSSFLYLRQMQATEEVAKALADSLPRAQENVGKGWSYDAVTHLQDKQVDSPETMGDLDNGKLSVNTEQTLDTPAQNTGSRPKTTMEKILDGSLPLKRDMRAGFSSFADTLVNTIGLMAATKFFLP